MTKQPSEAELPVYLLSGLAADASVFRQQQAEFPQLVVLPWLRPLRCESFQAYSERLAQRIPADQPCFVGGASFGRLVAMELAGHVNARVCILIGSVNNRQQLPWRIRVLRPCVGLLRWVPMLPFQWLARMGARISMLLGAKIFSHLLRQVAEADPETMRWSLQQVLQWDQEPLSIPIWHIHGDRDHVFPVSLVSPDQIVQGGGHVISLTHGAEVNQFLRRKMKQWKSEVT